MTTTTRKQNPMRLLFLIVLAVAIPVAAYVTAPAAEDAGSDETGTSSTTATTSKRSHGGRSYPPTPIGFERSRVGPEPYFLPQICNVQVVDFDGDGKNEILACDGQRDAVILYERKSADGVTPIEWEERVLGSGLMTPAHATVVDMDGDGDSDVVVSILVNILPDDNPVGSLVVLVNHGTEFETYPILTDTYRVADAQPADFDGDGDIDLAVAVFGYAHGEVLYLENRGNGRFRQHELLMAPGTIHVPVADYDGDGDPDIATVVSQNEEEVWAFENLGGGKFKKRQLWFTYNYDIGSAGLVSSDLDGDGDFDLILPVGDNFEVTLSFPQPYHGCLWLENKGNWQFETKRVASFGGTYAAAPGDIDADGDQDIVLVSMFNEFEVRENASIVWLENDGKQQFKVWQIDNQPTHLVTVACGDVDGDGLADIVGGGLHLPRPRDRIGRITMWRNLGRRSP